MPHDDQRESASTSYHTHGRNYMGAIVTISMLIALLFAANLYTLDRLNTARQEERDLRSSFGREIGDVKSQNQDLALKLALMNAADTRQITKLKTELDHTATQLDASTGEVLDRARVMVGTLQKLLSLRANALEEQIAHKADARDMASLMGSVASIQAQLRTAQKTLDAQAHDLGATRADLGELASSTHRQIETLRGFTVGSYHAFTLEKNRPARIGQLGLTLRKTNTRDQVFSLDLNANDREIRNRNHSVFEPMSVYVTGTQVPYEVVITTVGANNVEGYIRIPKPGSLQEKLSPQT